MNRITVTALTAGAALFLSGCSSFKLGTMLYCPFGSICTLQSVTPQREEEAPQPPSKAASA